MLKKKRKKMNKRLSIVLLIIISNCIGLSLQLHDDDDEGQSLDFIYIWPAATFFLVCGIIVLFFMIMIFVEKIPQILIAEDTKRQL